MICTALDLLEMPDDGKIYELHDGVLVEMTGSKKRQTALAAWIIFLLTQFIEEHGIGGLVSGADGTFVLGTYNTRIPDVAYISEKSLQEQPTEDGFFKGAPDLVVEVLSEANTTREMKQRVGAYLQAGSRLIWIVNADEQTVEVHRLEQNTLILSGGVALDGYDVLPGLRLPLPKIFERLSRFPQNPVS